MLNPKHTFTPKRFEQRKASQHQERDAESMIINVKSNLMREKPQIETRIGQKMTIMVLDSGADYNFISEKNLEQFKFSPEEAAPNSLTFKGGEKQVTDKRVSTEVVIGIKNIKLKFYVIKDLPVQFILGDEFLDGNDCTINYKDRALTIGSNIIIPFHEANKTTDEILDEDLSEKLCLTVRTDDQELINLINYYKEQNNSLAHMNVPPTAFKIEINVRIVQSKSYMVPLKYLAEAKAEQSLKSNMYSS